MDIVTTGHKLTEGSYERYPHAINETGTRMCSTVHNTENRPLKLSQDFPIKIKKKKKHGGVKVAKILKDKHSHQKNGARSSTKKKVKGAHLRLSRTEWCS